MNEMVQLRITCEKIHHLLSKYFHWWLSTSYSDVFGAYICSIRAGNSQVNYKQT